MSQETLVTGAWSAALREGIEFVSVGIEILAIGIIVVGIVTGTFNFARSMTRPPDPTAYTLYKVRLAKSLLLGLEILVAADIVRTVALEPTLNAIAALGVLVLVRTFLSWALVVEMEGRWPWQPRGRGEIEPMPSPIGPDEAARPAS